MESGPQEQKPNVPRDIDVKKLHKAIFDLLSDENGDPYRIINSDDKTLKEHAKNIDGLASKFGFLQAGRITAYNLAIHNGLKSLYEILKKQTPPSAALPDLEKILKDYAQVELLTQARTPDFRQRVSGKVKNVAQDMFLDESKRQAHLVSPKTYFFIRQRQMALAKIDPHKKVMQQGKMPSRFIDSSDPLFQKLNLKYPIFIGEKGEIISMMQTHQLGKGGSGMVFLGMDMDTGKQVAVKVQNPSFENSPQWLIDIEKQNLASLNRLIATAADSKGNIYTVDEYAWGRTFHDVVDDMQVKEEGLDALAQAEMALSFLEEMQQLHDAGFLHRDMRVDNMMWDPVNKKAKIIDFGLAVKYDSNGKFKGNNWVGNPDYIAPETLDGSFSIQSDVYATGIAIACLLTGAKDLSLLNSPNRIKQMNDISAKIMLMRSDDPAMRPSIKEVIHDIRKYKNKIEYSRFKESLAHASENSLNITSNDVANKKIKEKLYSVFIGDRSKEIKKFKKDSLFVLMLAASKEQNVDAFIAIGKHYGLSETKHKAYAQIIQKHVQASNNPELQNAFNQLTAGKTPEIRKPAVLHKHKREQTAASTTTLAPPTATNTEIYTSSPKRK